MSGRAGTARRTAAAALAAALLLASAPAAEDAAGEEVRFVTDDGVPIAATWYGPAAGAPPPAGAVVALPMYRHTRETFAPMVRPLAARGVALLAIDLRGHGGSARKGSEDLAAKVEARDRALFADMHLDAEAALAWLVRERKIPQDRIALLGASVGCSVAIDTAVRRPASVAAVACLSPGRNYLGVPTMEHVASWRQGKPLLLVTSPAESADARAIDDVLRGRGSELRTVWSQASAKPDAEDGLHGTQMFGRALDVEENLADWLAYAVAFHRIPLGGGKVAVTGSLGSHLYLGVEVADGSDPALAELTWKLGLGPVTDPWSKSRTLPASPLVRTSPTRARRKVAREELAVEALAPFAVAVSTDGRTFRPDAGAPPCLVTLR